MVMHCPNMVLQLRNYRCVYNRGYDAELERTSFDLNTPNLKVRFIYTVTCSIDRPERCDLRANFTTWGRGASDTFIMMVSDAAYALKEPHQGLSLATAATRTMTMLSSCIPVSFFNNPSKTN